LPAEAFNLAYYRIDSTRHREFGACRTPDFAFPGCLVLDIAGLPNNARPRTRHTPRAMTRRHPGARRGFVHPWPLEWMAL
jgi:hypothetical protein